MIRRPPRSTRTATLFPDTIVDASALRDEIGAVGEQRWSLVEAELEPGLRSLAVPVRSRTGAVVAALNVATFSAAHSRDHLLQNYLPALRAAAAQLARETGTTSGWERGCE